MKRCGRKVCARGLVAAMGVLLHAAFIVSVADAAEAKPAENCFRIFDGSGFRSKPDLSGYGLESTRVIYAINDWWPGRKALQDLPSRSIVGSWNRYWITSKRDRPSLVVIDIEHWPSTGSGEVVAESVRKHLSILSWVREDVGAIPVGYYSLPPVRDYWRATKGAGTPDYRAWQADNDRFKPLADALEVLTPSLYTFYEDVDGWERYATENIREARRLAPSKPIYPFIWPHYHDSSTIKTYLPGSYWLRQLQTLERLADGAVIWAPLDKWDPNAEWWRATQQFMSSSSRVCKDRERRPKAPVLGPLQP